jgi:uncharacterized protein
VNAARIASLHVYPVKGARALDVAEAGIAIEGLSTQGLGDREWMVVDAANRFISQRSHARLALVGVAVDRRALVLSIPGQAAVAIPLDAPQVGARDVVVWHSEVRGFDEGDAAANALSAFLGEPLRLMRFDARTPRLCNPDFAGDSGAHTRYADGYPLLVIGAQSLRDLNDRLAAKGERALPMNRFRPNLVIEGVDAFDEDHIDTLTVAGVVLKVVKPCIRCEVTTIDQSTAIAGDEPLLTLSSYRLHVTPLPGIAFGVNAIVQSGAGATLAVGDEVNAEFAF